MKKNHISTYSFWCILLTVLSFVSIQAQDCPYDVFMRQGRAARAQEDWQAAMDNFNAAKACIDISEAERTEAWREIELTLEKNLDKLEQLVQQAQRERAIANRERETADSLREVAEEKARQLEEQIKLTEANRLGLLANILRENRESEKALYLAFRGYSLRRDSSGTQIKLAFGQCVFAEMARPLTVEASITSLHPTPDGGAALVMLEDGNARLVNLETLDQKQLEAPHGVFTAHAFSPDGATIILTSNTGQISKWTADGKLIKTIDGHGQGIEGAFFSEDGSRVLTCSRDHAAKVWNAVDGSELATLSGHQGNVYEGAFTRNGRFLLTRSSDGTVRLWDAEGNFLKKIDNLGPYAYAAGFSPAGDRLLTASANGTAALWTLEGTLITLLEDHQGPVLNALFSPGGDRILTRSQGPVAHLWDSDGRLLKSLEGHRDRIMSIRFSPDSRYILTCSRDATAKLWDREGHFLFSFTGHQEEVLAAEFSPDGQSVLTTSRDGTTRLWDLEGNELMVINLSTDHPLPGRFSANGNYLITNNGEMGLWICPTPGAAFEMVSQEGYFSSEMAAALDDEYQVYSFKN